MGVGSGGDFFGLDGDEIDHVEIDVHLLVALLGPCLPLGGVGGGEGVGHVAGVVALAEVDAICCGFVHLGVHVGGGVGPGFVVDDEEGVGFDPLIEEVFHLLPEDAGGREGTSEDAVLLACLGVGHIKAPV